MAWTHLIFEAFCGYDFSKDKYTTFCKIDWDAVDEKGNRTMKTIDKERKLNPMWVKGRKRPAFCRKRFPNGKQMTPHPDCHHSNCPFLSLSEVTRPEYLAMMKAWEKMPAKYKTDI